MICRLWKEVAAISLFDLLSNEIAATALHWAQGDKFPKSTKSCGQAGTYCFSATSSSSAAPVWRSWTPGAARVCGTSCHGSWAHVVVNSSFTLRKHTFFVGLVNKGEVGGRAGGVPHDITAWCLLSNHQGWKSHIPSIHNTTAPICQHMTANLHKQVHPGSDGLSDVNLALTPTGPLSWCREWEPCRMFFASFYLQDSEKWISKVSVWLY